jgi:ubiquitin carboxyl-terminal hydrolase 7
MIPLNLSAALGRRKKFVDANDENTSSAGAAGTGSGSLLQLRAPNDTGIVFSDKSSTGYTGLINQGATCYLNSLLQTLFCIPEFKSALYRSEFMCSDDSMNLCRQLQKLFIELEFTVRGAISTCALTKSFGWSSRDSFQQQDVQECMTVIFEFIKVSYPASEVATWLATSWQGEILSSLVCHHCQKERSKRSETYRDLQLQVMPRVQSKLG